jgi:hypothetical protein
MRLSGKLAVVKSVQVGDGLPKQAIDEIDADKLREAVSKDVDAVSQQMGWKGWKKRVSKDHDLLQGNGVDLAAELQHEINKAMLDINTIKAEK